MSRHIAGTFGAAASLALAAAGLAGPSAAGAVRTGPGGLAESTVARGWLTSVATVSARDAWAVGASSGRTTLILHWNGSTWNRVPSPSPAPGGGASIYYGVAATSAHSAWAVGSSFTGTGSPRTLIVHWNGTAWRRVPSPTPTGGGALFSVAATSARSAWAVGYAGNPDGSYTKTLILHWNGAAWRRVPSPACAGGCGLTSVAAISARSAWAVGATSTWTLILRWNGTTWTRIPSPNPARNTSLNGVAATSATNAWAVGTIGNYPYQTVILRWGGAAWTRVPSPSPEAAGGSQLFGVTAASATSAWAVGYTGLRTLIAHWNGRTWTQVPSPGGYSLAGVAAAAAPDAWAVGAGIGHKTLILHWNDRTWKTSGESQPGSIRATPNSLHRVAASSPAKVLRPARRSPPPAALPRPQR